MADVKLRFTLQSKFYSDSKENDHNGTKGELWVFLPKTYSETIPVRIEMITGEACDAMVRFPSQLPRNTPLMVWWYTYREAESSSTTGVSLSSTATNRFRWNTFSSEVKPQRYRSRAGYGWISVCDLCEGKEVTMMDTENVQVASVVTEVVEVEEKAVELTEPLSPPFQLHETDVICKPAARAIDQSFIKRGFAMTYLPRYSFSTILLPIGRVPLWAYACTAAATNGIGSENKSSEALFQAHLTIARYMMAVPDEAAVMILSKSSIAWWCEFISVMMTRVTCHILYVPDTSKRMKEYDQPTDDWDYPRDDGIGGDDCEGLTALVLEECYRFQTSTFQSPVLRALQAYDKQYMPLFCIVGISIGAKAFTYHAVVIKLDEQWVRMKLGLPTKQQKNKEWLPVIVLESTTYTTSCSSYSDSFCTPTSFKRSHITQPIESNAKAPVSMVRNVYKHILVAVSPVLMRESKITRIDFINHNEQSSGVAFSDLFALSDNIELLPTYATSTEIEQTQLAYRCMPVVPVMQPPSESEPIIRIIRAADPAIKRKQTIPAVDMCFRFVDWSSELESIILEQTKTKTLEVAVLSLTNKMKGVRVQGWE